MMQPNGQLGLPTPPQYGYLGDAHIPMAVNLDNIQPRNVSFSGLAQQIDPGPMQIPDIIRVRYSAGDKQVVGQLYAETQGKPSGLTGVGPSAAADILTGWGYPSDPNAWDNATWDAALAANTTPNPFDLLGAFQSADPGQLRY